MSEPQITNRQDAAMRKRRDFIEAVRRFDPEPFTWAERGYTPDYIAEQFGRTNEKGVPLSVDILRATQFAKDLRSEITVGAVRQAYDAAVASDVIDAHHYHAPVGQRARTIVRCVQGDERLGAAISGDVVRRRFLGAMDARDYFAAFVLLDSTAPDAKLRQAFRENDVFNFWQKSAELHDRRMIAALLETTKGSPQLRRQITPKMFQGVLEGCMDAFRSATHYEPTHIDTAFNMLVSSIGDGRLREGVHRETVIGLRRAFGEVAYNQSADTAEERERNADLAVRKFDMAVLDRPSVGELSKLATPLVKNKGRNPAHTRECLDILRRYPAARRAKW